jgi:hypothetical protein
MEVAPVAAVLAQQPCATLVLRGVREVGRQDQVGREIVLFQQPPEAVAKAKGAVLAGEEAATNSSSVIERSVCTGR